MVVLHEKKAHETWASFKDLVSPDPAGTDYNVTTTSSAQA